MSEERQLKLTDRGHDWCADCKKVRGVEEGDCGNAAPVVSLGKGLNAVELETCTCWVEKEK